MTRGMPAAALGAMAGVLLALWPGAARGQEFEGAEFTDFRAPLNNHPPPWQMQVRTLLEGAKAQPKPEGKILLTAVKLKILRTNGEPEILAVSPQCLFDTAERTVYSDGPLQVETANGSFRLEGSGFSLQPTNSNLIISNQVHTTIRHFPSLTLKTKP